MKNNEYITPKICEGCKIPKGWGEEIIIENNELYCGKLLIFKAGCKFSMHFHMIKDETWYINEGEFLYKWINCHNADIHEEKLTKGMVIRQRPGQPHQLIALTDGVIFEVSTHHMDSDSYRIWKGDSQK
jgi:mannose-6-phosphate isomerase-like protein (cupin superfamily)